MKNLLGFTAALLLLVSLAPEARATPTLQGRAAGSSGVDGFCRDPYCAGFFAAGCPEALARSDGATASIVDVTDQAGKSFTFSFEDITTKAYDANPTIGWKLQSRVAFFVADSCPVPDVQGHPFAFTLGTRPDQRSKTYTLPRGATWLIVEPLDNAVDVHWRAD